jgi:hypothetical protein
LKQPSGRWATESRLEKAGKRQAIYDIIHGLHQMNVSNLIQEARAEDIDWWELKGILTDLEKKGLIYSPRSGVVVCVED